MCATNVAKSDIYIYLCEIEVHFSILLKRVLMKIIYFK